MSNELPVTFQVDRNNHQKAPLLIHPNDRNQINRFFGSGTAKDSESLCQAEMELIGSCYPQLKCNLNEQSVGNLSSGSDSTVWYNSDRLHRRFRDARYQQLVYFAEKQGVSEEGELFANRLSFAYFNGNY